MSFLRFFDVFNSLVQQAGCRQPISHETRFQSVSQIEICSRGRDSFVAEMHHASVCCDSHGRWEYLSRRTPFQRMLNMPSHRSLQTAWLEDCVPSILGRGYVPWDVGEYTCNSLKSTARPLAVCVCAGPVCLVGRGSRWYAASSSTRTSDGISESHHTSSWKNNLRHRRSL